MMTLKPILLLLVGLYCLPSLLQAQTITQDEFLDQLRQIHPLFEKERLSAQIAEEERNSYLGAQDWNVFSSVTFSHEKPALAFAGPDRTDVFSTFGGVERLFWKTGGRLSASHSFGYTDVNINPGGPDFFYRNQCAIAYVHPLLKNRGGFLDRLQYDLKQFDIDFSEVQALEHMEEFLAGAAAKFLDWVFLTEQKKIVSERSRLSEELRESPKKASGAPR